MSTRPEHDVIDQLNQAVEGVARGSRWPALSYEEGVMATLSWVLGLRDEKPMEDEEETASRRAGETTATESTSARK